MKERDNKLCIVSYLAFLLSFIWVTGLAADDWDWTNLPPGTTVVVSNNNSQKDVVATAYDSEGNRIHEEVITRPEPERTEPNYTVIRESDPDRREKAFAECNNSCEIHFAGKDGVGAEGDTVVIPNDSGKIQHFGDDGRGYRCLSNCDEEAPPSLGGNSGDGDGSGSGEGDSGSETDGSGAGTGSDGLGSSTGDSPEEEGGGFGGGGGGDHEDEEKPMCSPGSEPQCTETDLQVCLCGRENRETEKPASCIIRKFCLNNSDTAFVNEWSCVSSSDTRLERKIHQCLKRYVAPGNASAENRAKATCGHLIGDRCEEGSDRSCPNITCSETYTVSVPYVTQDGSTHYTSCTKCRVP